MPLEHPLVWRALEHPVDRVVVADRRRDGLGTVDHNLWGVRVPEGRQKVPFDRRANALTNHLEPLRRFVKTTKRFVGSGPRVRLSVHALCAALNLWTSRDAAAATAAQESARTRRIVNLVSNW